MNIAEVRRDLEAVAGGRVLFGHQSVGRNILAGVAALASECGVPLPVEEVSDRGCDAAPGLFHANIGTNGDPARKCEAFSRLLRASNRPPYDVALMKFCYVDLRGGGAGATQILNRYAEMVEELAARQPDVRIVHVTMPLRSQSRGWKDAVKRLVGFDVAGDSDNALRNAYNEELRRRYADGLVFDLAAIESTRPDGTRTACSHDQQTVYTLAPEYTDDGGHLNTYAQRLTAAAFLRTLAGALQRRRA